MSFHRVIFVALATLFTVGMTSLASACCDWAIGPGRLCLRTRLRRLRRAAAAAARRRRLRSMRSRSRRRRSPSAPFVAPFGGRAAAGTAAAIAAVVLGCGCANGRLGQRCGGGGCGGCGCGGGGWSGGCGGCGTRSLRAAPLYVVNQGPVYSRPGPDACPTPPIRRRRLTRRRPTIRMFRAMATAAGIRLLRAVILSAALCVSSALRLLRAGALLAARLWPRPHTITAAAWLRSVKASRQDFHELRRPASLRAFVLYEEACRARRRCRAPAPRRSTR